MEPDPSCVRAGFRNRLYEGNDNTAEASSRRQSGALAGRRALLPPHSTRSSSPPNSWMVGKPELIVRPKGVHAIWRWVALPSSRGL